jgi:hypothetical protein
MLVSMISPFVCISNVGTRQNNLKRQFVPHRKHSVSIATTMVREIISVCCGSHTKTRENTEIWNVKVGGMYWYHFSSNGSNCKSESRFFSRANVRAEFRCLPRCVMLWALFHLQQNKRRLQVFAAYMGNWQSFSHLRNYPPFMEPEVSLPCSLEAAIVAIVGRMNQPQCYIIFISNSI